MHRLISLAAALALGGCALTYHALARSENKTCGMAAFTGLVDLGAAAVGGLILSADNVDREPEYLVAEGVIAGSALVGFGSAIVCWQREQHRRDEQAERAPPLVHDAIPDSMRLDPAPADPEVRDATLEERGLVPARNPPPPMSPPEP